MNLRRASAALTVTLLAIVCTAVTALANKTDKPTPEGETTVIRMVDGDLFQPESVTIAAGDTIEWVNLDKDTIHTATAKKRLAKDPSLFQLPDGAKPFDSGGLTPGQKFKHRFTVPGTYKYFCVPHQPKMKGTIVVKPN